MNLLSRRIAALVLIFVTSLLAIGVQHLFAFPTQAQGGPSVQTTPSGPGKPPFQLPFTEPPGPDTWLLAQPYGNTTGAYFQRHTTYGASGGIHFGLDLAAPCGTEIVAIADGVVFAVDGSFGAAPHNLMIDHPQLEYASMYGHLLAAPDLHPGQIIKQGEVIALVGDSRGDCNQSPHLHLEIRDLKHFRKFNPINLIDADWNKLALYSSWGRGFMRDLDDPRKWQNLYKQPQAQVGGPIVNDFERTHNPHAYNPATGVTDSVTGCHSTATRPNSRTT
jgi:murein DD-endopeptidase MepM/ murein hydrolase activator NlpD